MFALRFIVFMAFLMSIAPLPQLHDRIMQHFNFYNPVVQNVYYQHHIQTKQRNGEQHSSHQICNILEIKQQGTRSAGMIGTRLGSAHLPFGYGHSNLALC